MTHIVSNWISLLTVAVRGDRRARRPQVLFESEVALGGLHGGVAERKLDLLERGVAFVGEL